jgi:hypothetical protein
MKQIFYQVFKIMKKYYLTFVASAMRMTGTQIRVQLITDTVK